MHHEIKLIATDLFADILTFVKRKVHNPVITAKKETMTNADQINFSLFDLPLISNIDGILIGTPEIIPAANGFILFPT
jgi:hypothetical protein|tara:strand:+ start:6556 stop:6789 length:234 start_codon:yes stop_codon:yes gene_type:complete